MNANLLMQSQYAETYKLKITHTYTSYTNNVHKYSLNIIMMGIPVPDYIYVYCCAIF